MADGKDSVLSSELVSKAFLKVFDDLAAQRLAALPLDKILIYMIDTVDSSALPYLGDQFNLLGANGWNASLNDAAKRDLIKRAIDIFRYKGTPYSIRRAMQSVGYYDVEFFEGVDAFYDGTYDYDASITYGSGMWAGFRIRADLGEVKGINPDDTDQLLKLIDAYKPVRSRLLGISYKVTVSDNAPQSEAEALAIGMTTQENATAATESEALTVGNAPLSDNFSSLVDGDNTLRVLNSLGVLINEYIF